MANFDTGQDILTNVLSRAEELVAGSAERETEAKAYLQAAYIAVVGNGFPWPWAKKEPPGILSTVAEITTGSVAVTLNSTAITFSSAPSVSVANRKFFVDADGVIYRISAHTAVAAAATLDRNFLGATATAAAYHVFQDEYNLASDFLRPFSKKAFLRSAHGSYRIPLIGEDESFGKFPYSGSGKTESSYCALIAERRLRLSPWPTDARHYEYPYIFHPGVLTFDGVAGTDTPIISPAEDRIILSFFGVGNLLKDKDDDRADEFLQFAGVKLQDMKRLAVRLASPRSWVGPGHRVSTAR